MLITFRSKATGPIMMFGEIATQLLKMMGQSGEVPGAIVGADVPRALANLKAAVAATKAAAGGKPAVEEEDDSSSGRIARPVGIATRAVPLIDLLERAAKAGAEVVWERN